MFYVNIALVDQPPLRTLLPVEQQCTHLSYPTAHSAGTFLSVNVCNLSARAFEFSTLRNFSTTASLDKRSTNLTSRASSFDPISVVSEALSPRRIAGTTASNYTKNLSRKIVDLNQETSHLGIHVNVNKKAT